MSLTSTVAGSAKLPAAVHLDLDGAADIFRVHGWPYEAAVDPLFETGLRHALDFFRAARIRATLFVIAQDLDNSRKRELIEEAVRQGHEIASHTITHRNLTTLARDEKWREIAESRERLATALGVDAVGFRAPGFHIDRESMEMVAAAGYRYDSSQFPGSQPHHHRDLVELYLPSYAPLPFPFHPCFSLVLGMPYFRFAFRRFLRTESPLVLLFHLTDFGDPLPPDQLRSWASRLYTLSHLSGDQKRRHCREMVELVSQHFQIGTSTDLLRHYHLGDS